MGNYKEYADMYLRYVDKIISFLPFKERFLEWKSFFLNPEKFEIKPLKTRIVDFYVKLLVDFIVSMLSNLPGIIFLLATVLVSITIAPSTIMFALLALAGAIIFCLLLPLLYILYFAVEFAVAKICGGKGSFTAHSNVSFLSSFAVVAILLPAYIVSILLTWISSIPVISCLVSPILMLLSIAMILVGIYSLFLKYKGFIIVHKYSGMRSAITVLVPWLALVAIGIAFVALLYLGLFTLPFLANNAAGSANLSIFS